MHRFAFVLAGCLAATVAAGETLKTLTMSRPAAGLASLTIRAGVGEIQIDGDSTDQIVIHVDVKAKEGLFFGDRQAKREAEALQIEARTVGDELALSLAPEHHGDTHWAEHWSVRVPPSFAASVKLGVGDVNLLDLGGDLKAEIGVGDVRIEGIYQSFGDVHASCGVGDASLRTPSGHNEGAGFIAHSLRAQGPGRSEIRVSAGVGDVKIRLR